MKGERKASTRRNAEGGRRRGGGACTGGERQRDTGEGRRGVQKLTRKTKGER